MSAESALHALLMEYAFSVHIVFYSLSRPLGLGWYRFGPSALKFPPPPRRACLFHQHEQACPVGYSQ